LVPGQSVHLEVEATGWRLFDGAGEAIPRPDPDPERGPEPVLPVIA
jgi:hypothetical protein